MSRQPRGDSRAASSPASLTVDEVPIDDLRPDPGNARWMPDDGSDALDRSMREFGFVQPVVARRQDRTIIGGHQRVVSALRLGRTTVPVVWYDGNEEQSQLLGLALNQISGNWDEQLLAQRIAGLQAKTDLDITLSGFGEDALEKLVRGLGTREKRERPEAFDLDEALEAATRAPRTKPGDLWQLGDHRLLCGDATKSDDASRLLGGGRAAMAITDPPYNVNLGRHGGQQRDARRRKPIANDALDPVAWEVFVRAWARNILALVDGAIYCFMSSKELSLVSRVLAEEGGHWSDTIIWSKDRFTLGRADYQRAYEPIWFGWREGAAHHWCGDRDQGDVWQIARPSESPLHPTMKPLVLIERAIANSSRDGDLVLDPFLGSGTTLIAAERTARVCAGVELDPVYVDVAVARWERFSGGTAERADE